MIRIFIVSFLLLIGPWAKAQFHQLKKYTIADGMPTTEVGAIHIDSKGYLWLSYAGGGGVVARYDGAEFYTLGQKDLDFGNYQHTFLEDEHGVWIYDLVSKIVLVNDGAVIQPVGPVRMHSFASIPGWGVLALGADLGVYHYEPDGMRWKLLFRPRLDHPVDTSCVYRLSHSIWTEHPLVIAKICSTEYQALYQVTDMEKGTVEPFEMPDPEMGFSPYTPFDLSSEGKFTVFMNGKKRVVRDPNGLAISVLQVLHHKDQLYVQAKTQNPLVNPIYRIDSLGIAHPLLIMREIVEKMEIDRSGYYWFSSQSGLLRVDPSSFIIFDDNPDMVRNLHSLVEDDQGAMWFGGYRDGLCYFDGMELHRLKGEGRTLTMLPGSYRDKSGRSFMIETRYGLIELKNGGWDPLHLVDNSTGLPIKGYYFHEGQAGELSLGASGLGMVLLQQPVIPPYSYRIVGKEKGIRLGNVVTIAQDSKGRYWCGRLSQGIALYDPVVDQGYTWLMSEYEHAFGAMSLATDSQGNLWIGSQYGLFLLETPENIELGDTNLFRKMIPVLPEIVGKNTVAGLLINDGHLIISTVNGHGFLDLESYYKDPSKALIFFVDTSTPDKGGAGEQNAIYIDSKDRVWIGKDRGVVCLDPVKVLQDTTDLFLDLPTIVAGDSAVDAPEKDLIWHLPVKKRYVTLQLRTRFNHTLDRRTERFFFRAAQNREELESQNFQSVGDKIIFDYLSPGEYLVEVQLRRNNQLKDQAVYTLRVPYAFVEDPMVWILGSVLIGILFSASFYFWRAAQDAKRRSALDHKEMLAKMHQIQIRALTTSLNPHFINNSLTWLQYKVKGNKEAVSMISRLSENIRSVFLHSRHGIAFHTIKEELRLVENYLFIQQLRYGDDLEFTLPDLSDRPELTSINVPIMQIQIHVENAVEHGVRNRNKPGWVHVHLDQDETFLKIRIEDNGVGRDRAREMQSSSTRQGTNMLRELREIFNAFNENKISMNYEDLPFLDPETGERVGTRVIVLIPKSYQYEFSTT